MTAIVRSANKITTYGIQMAMKELEVLRKVVSTVLVVWFLRNNALISVDKSYHVYYLI